jgi:energy-converting hydrogenase Eha subunit H
MNIFRLAAEIFIIYIAYRFIFDFLIPIYNTSKKVKQQFGQMQEKMQQMNAQQQQQQPTQAAPPKAAVSKDEYIDYEEVK